LDAIVSYAKKQGAKVVKDIWEEKDENGIVRMATLQTVRLMFIKVSMQIHLNIMIN